MLLRHRDVREAARDWETYSSDAPFRVPIPSEEGVRAIRQLPIESDPPKHRAWRKLVEPIFLQPTKPAYIERLHALIGEAVTALIEPPSIEVVSEFALPLQCRALALLLGMPQDAADEWISWGGHVFHGDDGLDTHKGQVLDDYLDRAFAESATYPSGNFFKTLLDSEIEGRRLTLEEAKGFANLAFAGGRDTVIILVSSTLEYLARNPQALKQLRSDPSLAIPATEELVRFASPISEIGRVCRHAVSIGAEQLAADERISLCWASANRDESVFTSPNEVILDRKPNPHLAFGSGKHNCLGAAHARAIERGLLTILAQRVERLEILACEPDYKEWPHYTRRLGYRTLRLRAEAR